MSYSNENLFKILKICLIGLIVFIILNFLGRLFLPFIIGYILCIILSPLFNILNKKYKIPKPISSILCIVIFIFVVAFLGTSIVSQIISEAKGFSKNIPEYIDIVKNTIENFSHKVDNMLTILPNSLEKTLTSILENSMSLIGNFIGNGLKTTSIKIIKKVPNALMITVISIISCYLMLMDKTNIQDFIFRQFPKNHYKKFRIVKSGISEAVMGYIKAQLIIMSLISTICFIGLMILKAPYALFIAVVIGFIDALPVFGSGFIIWPWTFYNLITENYKTAIGLITIYIVILVTRQFIEPRILGKQIGVHPLATLMSIYIGLEIFGIFGFIIGPIIVVIIKTLQNEGVLPKWR